MLRCERAKTDLIRHHVNFLEYHDYIQFIRAAQRASIRLSLRDFIQSVLLIIAYRGEAA